MRQFNAKYILGDWNASQAAAGTTQGTATTLTADHNYVATVTASANGVILKERPPGSMMSVCNADSADDLNVYPWSGAQLNGATANLPVTLPAGRSAWFFVHTQTKIACFY